MASSRFIRGHVPWNKLTYTVPMRSASDFALKNRASSGVTPLELELWAYPVEVFITKAEADGWRVSHSQTTNSIYVSREGSREIRISDHSSGVYYGSNKRDSTSSRREISIKWTKIRLVREFSTILMRGRA